MTDDVAKSRTVSIDRLRSFLEDSFRGLGASDSEAATCADVLVAADRFGIGTHGVQRLGYYARRVRGGVTRPGAPITTLHETATTAALDAGHGLGPVAAVHAMDRAVEKAGANGLGAVAVRNSTHFGIAGYYALRAVDAGMIGIVTTNARPCQAPTFGTAPLFGTNPIAFGAPSDEDDPFLFDAAMAQVQRGTIEVARREGRAVAEGIAVDAAGAPLTDAAAILDGLESGDAAMMPLGGASEATGGHKGYGLGIVVEILSAALAGGTFLSGLGGGDREGTWRPYGTGHFFLAMNVASFTTADAFRLTVGSICRELRASRRAPGHERVWTAGEKEWDAARDRDRDGVTITAALAVELDEHARALGIAPL